GGPGAWALGRATVWGDGPTWVAPSEPEAPEPGPLEGCDGPGFPGRATVWGSEGITVWSVSLGAGGFATKTWVQFGHRMVTPDAGTRRSSTE
ncbi:MAG TPA: hypothetical protein RMG48_09285, partial [Myxococcales bacterium LLY-WYZ-16_1]|nr:hypothetical protein [Myxococcales bacterium LLY-WYZ-16_1]